MEGLHARSTRYADSAQILDGLLIVSPILGVISTNLAENFPKKVRGGSFYFCVA